MEKEIVNEQRSRSIVMLGKALRAGPSNRPWARNAGEAEATILHRVEAPACLLGCSCLS